MNEVTINAHVYSHYYTHQGPTYRIWINNIVMTEREFLTSCKTTFVNETIIVGLSNGNHTLTFEKIRPATQCNLWIQKLTIKSNKANYDMDFGIILTNKQVIEFSL